MDDELITQKEVFLATEGNAWYQRNRAKADTGTDSLAGDQILAGMAQLGIEPRTVLEIGCSNGWRLHAIADRYRAQCYGIDPSREAITDGLSRYPGLSLRTGTAENLPFDDGMFDTTILGFCLYLCDRRDLMKIACEVDRVISEKGYIVILDFHPPFPYRNPYSHYPGVYCYKMQYANLFSWNPAYTTVWEKVFSHSGVAGLEDPDDRISVVVLKKGAADAYPTNPFGRSG
jgi:ubiquinone/menaquinone biosynthesis C-methylase UbiE